MSTVIYKFCDTEHKYISILYYSIAIYPMLMKLSFVNNVTRWRRKWIFSISLNRGVYFYIVANLLF